MLVSEDKATQKQDSEITEEGKGRDCHPSRGSITNSTPTRSKEASEETSENNQKGCVIMICWYLAKVSHILQQLQKLVKSSGE
jgi:hypothetical protein